MITMAKPFKGIVILFLIFFLSENEFSLAQANEYHPHLTNQLNHLLENHPNLKGAIAGVSIRTASTGDLIYSYNGETRLTPASNLKLFTAAAALTTLGKDYTFQTELHTDGEIKWHVLIGNLYIKGKGDPTITTNTFDQFAKELKKKGIKWISGDLIGDDSWYDDVRYSIDIPWSDETAYYGAQISALTVSPDLDYDSGTIICEVSPGEKTNQKATVSFSPETDYVQVINKTKTVEKDGRNDITISRNHGTNIIQIEGTIPLNDPLHKESIAVWEPTKYSLNVFKQALHKQGIKLLGDVKVGDIPSNSQVVISHSSMPLSELLLPFMKLSNNIHAEVLIKEMGKVFKGKGSFKEGLEVEEHALTSLGVKTETMIMRDGSGISHMNLVPPNEITRMLYHLQDMDWFPCYMNSLPVAGIKDKMIGGTLRNRMKGSPLKENVIAKTGTLTNVSSLSGYVKTKNGETFIFSILLNHLKGSDQGKQIEEQILNTIANTIN